MLAPEEVAGTAQRGAQGALRRGAVQADVQRPWGTGVGAAAGGTGVISWLRRRSLGIQRIPEMSPALLVKVAVTACPVAQACRTPFVCMPLISSARVGAVAARTSTASRM